MKTSPIYWSVQRELWEYRWIYIGPVFVAGVVLVGFLISATTMPHRMHAIEVLDQAQQTAAMAKRFGAAAMYIVGAAVFVGVLYCIEALQRERRDRSILFWKSLPVSDLTTVLSKATIPLLVLPVLTFAVIVATQVIMLVLSTALLPMSGLSAAVLWTQFPLFRLSLLLLYFLAALTLWHAPIYGWLLLLSAWARRTAFVWAVLPLLAIGAVERVVFGTSYFASMLMYRWAGLFAEAFAFTPQSSVGSNALPQLTPGNFLSTPGLWIGLAFAAACVAAAVRLRRYREPI